MKYRIFYVVKFRIITEVRDMIKYFRGGNAYFIHPQ